MVREHKTSKDAKNKTPLTTAEKISIAIEATKLLIEILKLLLR